MIFTTLEAKIMFFGEQFLIHVHLLSSKSNKKDKWVVWIISIALKRGGDNKLDLQ